MSLTSWLTDYVFIPQGGPRVKPGRVYGNIPMTMLVSGIWHGAGVNFVVWGLWQIVARHFALHPWGVAKAAAAAGKSAVVVARGGVAGDICRGESGLGVFLHGCTYGAVLFQAATTGVMK
jgi:hypothetical protein